MSAMDDMRSLNKQLGELVEYNRAMLRNAEAGNWDKVKQAERQRRGMLEAFYSSADARRLPGVTEATREMLQINREIEKLTRRAQTALTTDAVSINKGRRAINSYSQHQG